MFNEPIGFLIKNDNITMHNLRSRLKYTRHTIVIGDATALTMCRLGIHVNLTIIDGHTQRDKQQDVKAILDDALVFNVDNPPGMITDNLGWVIRRNLNMITRHADDRFVIMVDGEEDLAIIPCLMYAPKGTTIIYGQPPVHGDPGIVVVTVDDKLKKMAAKIYFEMEVVG